MAGVDILVAADGVWPDDAWCVETVADDDPLGTYSSRGRRAMCWCRDDVVVIARDNVYTLDIEAIADMPSSQAMVPD